MKVLADYNTWKEFPTMPKTVPDEILKPFQGLVVNFQSPIITYRITGQEFMRRANKRTTQSDVDELLKIIEDYERTR